jgi:hypothetical protein
MGGESGLHALEISPNGRHRLREQVIEVGLREENVTNVMRVRASICGSASRASASGASDRRSISDVVSHLCSPLHGALPHVGHERINGDRLGMDEQPGRLGSIVHRRRLP